MSYDPTLGRWIQTDPIGYDDGMNLYQMEKSNPVASLDPDGQKTEKHTAALSYKCEIKLSIGWHSAGAGGTIHSYIRIQRVDTDQVIGTISGKPQRNSGPKGLFLGFGKLVYVPDSDIDDDLGRMPSAPLPVDGQDAHDALVAMDIEANKLDERYDYKAAGPNSNTFTHAVLLAAGFWVDDPSNAPGWVIPG
ncbi:MAG TPA: RHS repeat-associated core domain-containing protein [Tepidisphaeraceae bacterium]|nr:RHS repeat-associated core domain-containing protein [Tepidisphaeraceae bacterium]